MREHQRQHFRWAPHVTGVTPVKPRDYEEAGAAEGDSVYSVWESLRAAGTPLDVGDILAAPDDTLRIFKYVGFDEAHWVLPEVKTGLEGLPTAAGAPPAPGPA